MAIAANHLLSIGSFARTDFFWAFSRRLTYLGTPGSSAHQKRMAKRREMMFVASRLTLPLEGSEKVAEGHLVI